MQAIEVHTDNHVLNRKQGLIINSYASVYHYANTPSYQFVLKIFQLFQQPKEIQPLFHKGSSTVSCEN